MKVGKVSNSFIAESLRLDGNFHLSEGLIVRALIKKSPYGMESIGDVSSDIYCPGIFKRNYTKTGIPFLGGSDIQKSYYDSGKYLRKSTTPNHEVLTIPQGCTLVTCGGTIGETAFANKIISKCFASQHVLRVIPSKVKEGLLYAYLTSKYGHALLTTNTYGTVIQTLNAGNIESLPIPLFPSDFQFKIDSLIQESSKLREEAYTVLEKAKSVLMREASLRDLNSEDYDYYGPRSSQRKVSCFVRNIQEIGTTTINAFNHSERIRRLKQSFSCPTIPLRETLLDNDTFSSGSFPRIEVSSGHGIMLINQRDIFDTIIKGKFISKRGVKTDNLVKYGEILIAGVGTLGEGETFCRVIFANEDLEGQLVSGEFIRMKTTEDIPSGYLYAWLNSDYGFRLLRNLQAGTKLCRPIPKLLLEIPVPIIDMELMSQIDNMVLSAHTKRHEANIKELQAISMVEQEIEKWNN